MRARQKMYHHEYGDIMLREAVVLENGAVENRLVDQSKGDLPDRSVTDLKTCLKAGIDLKRVNCKLLASTDSSPIELSVEPEKKTQSNEGDN